MMRSLLFWGLFPLVLPQAIHLRKNAPRFTEAAGPREGSAGSGRNLNLIAIGDSIISGVGTTKLSNALVGQTARGLAEALNCRINWIAFGSTGAGSNKVLHQLVPELPGTQADFIILSVGVNDVTSLSRVSTWTRNLSDLLNALRRHSPDAIVALAGIPPLRRFPLLPRPLRVFFGIRAETFDIAARRVVSAHPPVVYAPLELDPEPEMFAADGFHPSEESCRDFGQYLAGIIVERFKADTASGT